MPDSIREPAGGSSSRALPTGALDWTVGDLATHLFGLDGMFNGEDHENHAHTAKSRACVSL